MQTPSLCLHLKHGSNLINAMLHCTQPDGLGLESCEPINQWVIIMQGPDSGPCGKLYQGQVFRLSVKFPGESSSRNDLCSRFLFTLRRDDGHINRRNPPAPHSLSLSLMPSLPPPNPNLSLSPSFSLPQQTTTPSTPQRSYFYRNLPSTPTYIQTATSASTSSTTRPTGGGALP